MKCSMIQYESTIYTDTLIKNNRAVTPLPHNKNSVSPKRKISRASLGQNNKPI